MEKEIKEKTNTEEENSTDKEKNVAKEKKPSKVKKNREKLIKENAKFSFIFEKGMSEAIKDFWKSKAGLITVACVFVICLITGIVLDNTSVSAFYVKPATENTNMDVNKPNEVANGGNGILGLGDKKDGIDDGRTTEEVMIDNYKSALEKYGVMSETYVFYPDQAENFKNLMRNFENSLNARKYDECDTISAEIGEMMKTVMASNREIIGNL
ncbi:MAG: hypothetical protein MJ113_01995, partial [Lachnospiraceae bacterium]|nr:hypothetical protein [Lachnospiraceae bacterium]